MKKRMRRYFAVISVLFALCLMASCGKTGTEEKKAEDAFSEELEPLDDGELEELKKKPSDSEEEMAADDTAALLIEDDEEASTVVTEEDKTTVEKKKKKKTTKSSEQASSSDVKVEKNGTYTSKEEVAAYIHEYGELPSNYITKNEAKALGWDNRAGNLDEVAPGKSIGGDYFGNYDGLLPSAKGRKYAECDIDYEGGFRGAKRIIYSNDGLIFYTEDHYNSFEQLY